MKRFWLLLLVGILLIGCKKEEPLEKRILGTWSGREVNVNGEMLPATWEFLEGGTLIARIPSEDITYELTWELVQDKRINIFTHLAPEPTYLDVEFVSDDEIKLIEVESGNESALIRVDG